MIRKHERIRDFLLFLLTLKFAPRFRNLVPAYLLDLLAMRVMKTDLP